MTGWVPDPALDLLMEAEQALTRINWAPGPWPQDPQPLPELTVRATEDRLQGVLAIVEGLETVVRQLGEQTLSGVQFHPDGTAPGTGSSFDAHRRIVLMGALLQEARATGEVAGLLLGPVGDEERRRTTP